MCYVARFLSTPSARRATWGLGSPPAGYTDFYPRPPRGGRRRAATSTSFPALFLSTPSARRATLAAAGVAALIVISIHALREEGDVSAFSDAESTSKFLSTPSARRATSFSLSTNTTPCDFYPRPPRGGRLFRTSLKSPFLSISIHALREEGDICGPTAHTAMTYFYPRPPRGGRLQAFGMVPDEIVISIHALREEGDAVSSLEDATSSIISIHALREEGDSSAHRSVCRRRNFYPRPPRGGRPDRRRLPNAG